MAKKQLTIVVECDDQIEIRNYWREVVSAKSKVDILEMQVGNYVYMNEMLTQYVKVLREYSEIAPFGEIRLDSLGEHFWMLPGGIFSNDPDIFKATKIFRDLAALEASEGVTTVKPTEGASV